MAKAKSPAKQPAPKKSAKPRRRGTVAPPVCDAPPSRCPTCGSSEREGYSNTTEYAIVGRIAGSGQEYTHVVWRTTKCKCCGQVRRDRSYENRAA